MEITGLQFFTLAAIGIAFVVYLIWRSEAVDRITKLASEREEEETARKDEAERRRMVHDADLKDASLRGKANLEELLAASNGVNTDEYRRRISAGIANQHHTSMAQPSGKDKKTRERKQESSSTEWESHSPLFFGAGADPEPSRPSSNSSYSGHGGSFDGGGASSDWSSSSSSSSDSGSCSSSSSDSGSSSCSSSD